MNERAEGFEPPVFNTHGTSLRGHFESYTGEPEYENGEREYDQVRKMIADHFGVPYTEGDGNELADEQSHIFVVDNTTVKEQRHHRAFSVIIQEDEAGKRHAWYADGRVPHAELMNRLRDYYHIQESEAEEIYNGFLDPNGFNEVDILQKYAEKQGEPLWWFVRDTVSPDRKKKELEKFTKEAAR